MVEITRFCVKCRQPVPAARVARGSCFCSEACRRQDRNERRQAQAEKYCRLCHRPLAQKPPKEA